MQLAGVERGETKSVALLSLIEEAGEHLQRVGALLVDVVARVASHESFQRSLHKEPVLRRGLAAEVEGGCGVAASGTADENLTFVLRVEVDEHVARHESSLHSLGTRQARLFIAREDTLQRTVLDVVGVEDSQFDGTSNAVVGTQRGAFGLQPFSVHIGLNGVAVEIELHVHQFLAHHVHVALQHHGGAVLHAFCGRLANQHVASFVHFCCQSAAFAKLFQEGNHLLFTLRRARNLVDFCELLEHASRF